MPWIDTESAQCAAALLPGWFLAHWQKLALAQDLPDPFCCGPVWNLAYHQTLNRGRRIYYAASRNAALMFGKVASMAGVPMFLPMEDSWFYGQPLLGPDAPALLATVLPDLLSDSPVAPQFLISGIIERTRLARELCGIVPAGWALYRYARYSQCSASLEGGLDGWLARRSANCRQALRKSARKAAQAGICYERVRPAPEEVDALYERILAVEAKSWKGIGHCGMAESPSREFYQEMLRLLAPSGDGLVIFAKIGDEDVGFIFGGIMGPYYRGQQFSYAQEWARLSPGNLLQVEKIRWLCELGIKRYDMGPAMGPRMEYKRHWTENSQEFQTWIMRREN